jgi:hypothetical protein
MAERLKALRLSKGARRTRRGEGFRKPDTRKTTED